MVFIIQLSSKTFIVYKYFHKTLLLVTAIGVYVYITAIYNDFTLIQESYFFYHNTINY